ncbi:MAG: hypothetical protein AB7S36_01935 [Planctomycetota bacterium]
MIEPLADIEQPIEFLGESATLREYLLKRVQLRAAELTHRGDAIPDAAALAEATRLKGKGANAFGLWGLGLYPEPCADRHCNGYDDAPTDGGPVRGAGPRIVRGGAARLAPWQQVGECSTRCAAPLTTGRTMNCSRAQ